uniref:Sushi, von Willebrand factor type A, EGF and pentraxin domain-containing protein 1 n=1 Tax=Trichogramma kaykai TaxID=54128 RepID=A0ABD2WSD8_9HYME
MAERRCGHPAVPMNTRVSLSDESLRVGTIATYTCDPGYELFGSNNTICNSRGKWQGELPACGVNVGYRKPANQSTTVRGGDASHANDGDFSTEHDGKRCTETQKEHSPWWRVDLLKPYAVKVVRVTTRGCCEEGMTKTFTCARALIGQYVYLQLVGVESSLSICEVEVFATDEFSVDKCAQAGTAADADLAAFNSTCYEFAFGGKTFQAARSYCQSRGGDLVHGFIKVRHDDPHEPNNEPANARLNPLRHTTTTRHKYPISFSDRDSSSGIFDPRYAHNLRVALLEQGAATTFVTNNLERRKSKLKTTFVWIGAQKEPSTAPTPWKWVDGEVIQKPQWAADQPNNYNREQNCVVFDGGRSWLWNDVGCNLDYLHWICQSKPSACGSPEKSENTTILNTNRKIGSTIEYACPDGHMLIGSKNRTCESSGFWSGSPPTCKFVDCGELESPEHGRVKLLNGRTTHGAIVEYKCEENYTLVGDTARKCGDGGIWSGHQPQCLFDWCPEPPEIKGGLVSFSGKRTGSKATYTCQKGFVLFGDNVLTCDIGGQWSGKRPECRYVDCGSPAQLSHGQARLLNGTTSVGSVVEYSCDEDYWVDGKPVQECTREGKWSHPSPSCELITCEEPEVPNGSYVVGYDLYVHSTIEYHCEEGYLLRGQAKHTCDKNGEWTGQLPHCQFIDCGKVLPVPNGSVDYVNGTTYLNSEIAYSCAKNYRLNGSSRRYCLDNGIWSDATPKCEEIRCLEPTLAKHGILSLTGNDRMYGRTLIRTGTAENSNTGATSYKIGALAKYRCERGYKVVGDSLSTCEENGKWSGDVPQCVYVDCGKPEEIQHGRYTLTSNVTYYGAAALYECDVNYELDGFARRQCLENATWSSEPPLCKEIKCKEPDKIGMASAQVSTYSVGGVAHYNCPRGYIMEGNATRICQQNGSWSGSSPSCFAVDCKHPPLIENGRVIVVNGTTTFGGAAEYHCLPQFERSGLFLRKCLDTGSWSGEEPKCIESTHEMAEVQGVGTSVGISAAIIIVILIIIGIVYLRLRKATPVKNTENVQAAERKEDQNAAVMSYATLNDGTTTTMYENVPEDGLYDNPYSMTGSTYGYGTNGRRTYNNGRSAGHYEAEPVNRNGITINGVAVR